MYNYSLVFQERQSLIKDIIYCYNIYANKAIYNNDIYVGRVNIVLSNIGHYRGDYAIEVYNHPEKKSYEYNYTENDCIIFETILRQLHMLISNDAIELDKSKTIHVISNTTWSLILEDKAMAKNLSDIVTYKEVTNDNKYYCYDFKLKNY